MAASLDRMTKKQQTRDSAYFERRLLNDFPAIHADLMAGKYKTINAAAKAAGLVKPPAALNVLKNAWSKANAVERKQFIAWVRGGGSAAPAGLVGKTRPVVTSDGYLLEWAKTRIAEIMDKRGLTNKQVMLDLGSSPLDASLWRAIRRKDDASRIRADLARALEKWIHDNRSA